MYAFGQIFIAENGPILKTQSGRLVTLTMIHMVLNIFSQIYKVKMSDRLRINYSYTYINQLHYNLQYNIQF